MAKYTNRLQVSVSDKLYSKLRDKADYSGASLPEYVRYVLMKEMEKDYEEIITDDKLEKSIKEGVKKYRDGKTKKFSNAEEAIEYLDEYVKKNE
jgi:tryptophan synthase beta subunit